MQLSAKHGQKVELCSSSPGNVAPNEIDFTICFSVKQHKTYSVIIINNNTKKCSFNVVRKLKKMHRK